MTGERAGKEVVRYGVEGIRGNEYEASNGRGKDVVNVQLVVY